MLPLEARAELQEFALISAVRPDDARTWDGRSFLTFDIDWAQDDVIHHSIDLVEAANAKATWFITHDTPVLERLRANPLFELGIHPNFLPLVMQGSAAAGASAAEVVDRLLQIVPEARSVRSHSLVQSGRLLQLFKSRGLTHDANVFLPLESGMVLAPWVDWFEMIRVPYCWEDDFWCERSNAAASDALRSRGGMRGYDFHPIHVFLNSESLDRYEAARPDFEKPAALRLRRNVDRFGTSDFLQMLLGTS